MVVWWTGEVFSIPFSSSPWRELRFSSPSLTIISTNGMLMGCLWFWSWKHFLVTSGWFVLWSYCNDFLMPTRGFRSFWSISFAFLRIFLCLFHFCGGASCSLLCYLLLSSFQEFHFYKDPFSFGSWLLSKIFVSFHLAKYGKSLPASMELTQLLPWPRAEHPSVSRVCWLSRNCLYIAHCMTDGI